MKFMNLKSLLVLLICAMSFNTFAHSDNEKYGMHLKCGDNISARISYDDYEFSVVLKDGRKVFEEISISIDEALSPVLKVSPKSLYFSAESTYIGRNNLTVFFNRAERAMYFRLTDHNTDADFYELKHCTELEINSLGYKKLYSKVRAISRKIKTAYQSELQQIEEDINELSLLLEASNNLSEDNFQILKDRLSHERSKLWHLINHPVNMDILEY